MDLSNVLLPDLIKKILSDCLAIDIFSLQNGKPLITFYDPRLTSGLSRDGILMIRVPKRVSPERIIPIQFDTKISAVKNAIQQTVQHVETEMTAEEVHQELLKENIAPLTIEKEEDAVQAASAEVIEAMTIGVAEEAGGEVIKKFTKKSANNCI